MNAMAAPGLFTRLAGIILLAVFGAGQLPVVPLLMAAAAAIDGEHEVELLGNHNGVRLVLHHHRPSVRDNASLPAGHHHRGLMRFIAGKDSGTTHPDHELLFPCADSLAKKMETPALTALLDTLADSPGISIAAGTPGLCLDRTSARPSPLPRCWWPPPPADCAWGSIVLLV